MSLLKDLPEHSLRRLTKVCVRSLHLVGSAGVFGSLLVQAHAEVYLGLAMLSGLLLVVMEARAGAIWFVQLRGVALYLKLLLLLLIHLHPPSAIPALISVIAVSGFVSHAPSWVRYYSLQHGRVVHSREDLLG